MKRPYNIIVIVLLTFFMLNLQSCSVNYGFTGAPITAKTITIDYFPNKASLVNPVLSQEFTQALRDEFVGQTKLQLVKQNGQLQLSGAIVNYYTTAMAIQGNEQAALNRLSITINVKFVNTLNEEESFEQDFTGFQDYDASQNFAAVEGDLVNTIIGRMVQDIFNRALLNW